MPRFMIAALLLCLASPASSEDAVDPHHVSLVGGGTWHGDKTAAFLGIDYVYRFRNSFGVGAFAEEVSGDFDLRAFGLIFGKHFNSGFKLGFGPGVETKLDSDKTLFLVHLSGGYDWTRGQWTAGPVGSIDFIEDESTSYYLGISVGYEF